jgi:hypothetical protein
VLDALPGRPDDLPAVQRQQRHEVEQEEREVEPEEHPDMIEALART